MRAVASRRGFLRGIATVSAVAGTVAAPYALRAAPVEDAELLRLGVELDRAGAAYLACRAAKADCVARFKQIEPALPPEILRPRGDAQFVHHDWPPNPDGNPDAKLAGENFQIRIYERFELRRACERLDGRTRQGKRARELKAKVDAFYAAHEQARRAAGIPQAEERCFYAGRAVLEAGFKIAAITATTMPGLSVKGRSGLAMHRVWRDDGGQRVEDSYAKLLRNLATIQGGEIPLCA